MKFKQLSFVFVLGLLLMAGCAKTDDILVKKEGRWMVERFQWDTYEDGVLTDETDLSTEIAFMTFNEDGTVLYEDAAGNVDNEVDVTWSYNEDSEVMTIVEDYSDPTFTLTITYPFQVLESNRSEQEWQYIVTEDVSGTEVRWEIYLDLERAD